MVSQKARTYSPGCILPITAHVIQICFMLLGGYWWFQPGWTKHDTCPLGQLLSPSRWQMLGWQATLVSIPGAEKDAQKLCSWCRGNHKCESLKRHGAMGDMTLIWVNHGKLLLCWGCCYSGWSFRTSSYQGPLGVHLEDKKWVVSCDSKIHQESQFLDQQYFNITWIGLVLYACIYIYTNIYCHAPPWSTLSYFYWYLQLKYAIFKVRVLGVWTWPVLFIVNLIVKHH